MLTVEKGKRWKKMNLRFLLEPESIAVAGASDEKDSVGHGILASLLKGSVFPSKYAKPFSGKVFPAFCRLKKKSIWRLLRFPRRSCQKFCASARRKKSRRQSSFQQGSGKRETRRSNRK